MQAHARVRTLEEAPINPAGTHVLYWMTAARRTRSSYALDRAIEWARELGKPLWVLEALRLGHPHASARLHAFVVRGMCDNAARFEASPIGYYPYVEPKLDAGKGLLAAFARKACVVVTDDWPVYFVRNMTRAAAAKIGARMELVDGVGLVPMSAPDRCFARAHDFRRWCQKHANVWLGPAPRVNPLARLQLSAAGEPPINTRKWPAAPVDRTTALERLGQLAFAREIPAIPDVGGSQAARARLRAFVATGLERYAERNQPAAEVTSGLSAYLHWGQIGAHEVLRAVLASEPDWDPGRISELCRGQREGWWGMSPAREGFLDQLLTWREVGHNFVWHHADYARFESLPAWARTTLRAHASDERPELYSLEQFEAAATHDPIWNAAQRELVSTGAMHNYLRMLWGKKILHWSASPRAALEIMITLNDRYALDGRDPNSYSGIGWVLGRFDRAWGPERAVFGKVRYMSSESTRRKLRLNAYLQRFGPG
ncbi:Deoxyribodipyrimidine photolyase, type II [Enhygromyxa salina]|uniref:Deoxyribodipyrimidine photo-lyase n=1 Tax=Enhygromyxa salina TaxID=215803 RepID=A0A0C2D846_9BACT|nr:FAD-binding domain-containing protein [Enhygromyxa salina]KIG17780.1 Deoxyribodipyrimidine photolyase, type II [Enhygromyxa salina]